VNGGMDLHTQLRAKYAGDPDVLVEEVECLAHCDHAPAFQVNYDFHGPDDLDGVADLIERYKDGQLALRTISGTAANEVR